LLTYNDDQNRAQQVTDAKSWARRREQILTAMQEIMGALPDRARLPPLDVIVLEEVKEPEFTRYSITFAADTHRVPAYLYVPARSAAAPKKSAAVLALHQTNDLGKKEVDGQGTPDQGYARELAKRGYVVLAPDYPSFGDYKCDFADPQYVSGTMLGIFNHMRCLDLLAARDDVDAARIGAIGHSLGGHNAMFLAAFDERVRAVVSSCGWTLFPDYYGGDLKGWTSKRYMPLIRDRFGLDPKRVPFDIDEVVAAFSPRAFLSISPTRDDNFAVTGVRKAILAAREVYKLLDAEERLQVRYPECGHSFPEQERLAAYEFLDMQLQHTPPSESGYGQELPRIPAKEPKDALAALRIAHGYRVELAAAEPLVTSPVAVAWDEQARMYVVEMRGYSEHRDKKLSRVRLLVDQDNDGKYDRATIFVDQLLWPTAVACWDGGVFIADAPDIWYCKDTDDDGVADLKRRVFTGFGTGNVQGLVNTLLWHHDNRIHGTASSNGGTLTAVEIPNAKPVPLNGRDFSFDPRTLNYRGESGGAQHGMTFDDWGRKFVCSNSDHVQQVMFEDRYLERNKLLAAPSARLSIAADGPQAEVFRASPVEPWRIVRTRLRTQGIVPGIVEGGGRAAGYFTGASGGTILRGDAFPEKDRGCYVVGDVGSNLVHRKRLRLQGLEYAAERIDNMSEFVASTDIWFRPAQFSNGPDGALYVVDVCREVIEHPQSLPLEIKRHLDLESGRERGRIFRVVPVGYHRPTVPRLDRAATADLVKLLTHPNAWHRETAARLLFQRQDTAAVAPLLELASSLATPPIGRVHALYALAGLGKLNDPELLAALQFTEPRVREHAIRLAEGRLDASRALHQKLAAMTDDHDAQVRYQLAFTLGFFPQAEKTPAIAKLLERDAGDRWLRLACLSSLGEGGAGDVLALILDNSATRDADKRLELLAALAAQVAREQRADELAALLRRLDKRPAGDLPMVSTVLVALHEGSAERGASFTKSLPSDAASIAARLLQKSLAAALATASNGELSPTARVRAVEALALAHFDQVRDLLGQLLEPRQPREVQLAVLKILAASADSSVSELILRSWPGLSPAVRRAAADVLLSRPERALALLTAIDEGRFQAAELERNQVELLKNHPAATVRQRAQKLRAPADDRQRQAVVDAYRPALALAGDAVRGKSLFKKNCAACHKAENEGHDIGPNLAAAKNRGAEALLLNILDPNREANPQYLSYVLVTRDGRVLSGMVAAETATSVTLKRADGQGDVVLRETIDTLQSSGVSLMPEGLEKELDPPAMADVLAYLLSLN